MIRDLYKHMQWADAVMWQFVLDQPPLENDIPLKDLLYHIHLVQRAFFCVWTEQPMKFPEISDFENLRAIATWGHDYHQRVTLFLAELTETDWDRPVELPWAERIVATLGKAPANTTLAQTLYQVTSHSTHHRGQVLARIRELGSEPPLVDFIAWCWLGQPAAEWPAGVQPH